MQQRSPTAAAINQRLNGETLHRDNQKIERIAEILKPTICNRRSLATQNRRQFQPRGSTRPPFYACAIS